MEQNSLKTNNISTSGKSLFSIAAVLIIIRGITRSATSFMLWDYIEGILFILLTLFGAFAMFSLIKMKNWSILLTILYFIFLSCIYIVKGILSAYSAGAIAADIIAESIIPLVIIISGLLVKQDGVRNIHIISSHK